MSYTKDTARSTTIVQAHRYLSTRLEKYPYRKTSIYVTQQRWPTPAKFSSLHPTYNVCSTPENGNTHISTNTREQRCPPPLLNFCLNMPRITKIVRQKTGTCLSVLILRNIDGLPRAKILFYDVSINNYVRKLATHTLVVLLRHKNGPTKP